MVTLYIDHNVIAKEDHARISNIRRLGKSVEFMFSVWNVYEIGNGEDVAQALIRAKFVEDLNPTWITSGFVRQQEEVTCFVWKNYYGKDRVVLPTTYSNLNDLVDRESGKTGRPYTVTDAVKGWLRHRDALAPQDEQGRRALTAISNADKALRKERKPILDAKVIRRRLPAVDPNGKAVSVKIRERLVEYCIENLTLLYQQCPTMEIEEALYQVRTSNPSRKSKLQDARDLQHALCGLACDHFITGDGYLRTCCDQIAGKVSHKVAQRYASFTDYLHINYPFAV